MSSGTQFASRVKCLQAAALANAAGVEVALPDQTRRTAAKWWSATRNMVPSLSHSNISQQLRQHGVPHTLMVPLGEGLPTADIAIQPKTGGRAVAVQARPSLSPPSNTPCHDLSQLIICYVGYAAQSFAYCRCVHQQHVCEARSFY